MEEQTFLTILGEQLRKKRIEQDYSQAEVAHRVEIDEELLGLIEDGKYDFEVHIMFGLSDVLDISIGEIFAYIKSMDTADN